ncbi:MAG: glycosyltransferase family 39 protein [Parvularculaceae bacterium]
MKSDLKNETVLLGAILIAAAVLRLIHLNDGLWYDEMVTVVTFVRLPAGDLLTTYGSLNNHLLYTWLSKAATFVFSEAPWAVRLPAAAFGVASIWACWRLMRDAGFAGVALATAALLAVSYHHVWFSQNARGYTGMLLFTTLSGVYMARGLNRRSAKDWMLYAVFASLALLTHLTSAFVLTAQGLTALGFGYREVFIRKNETFLNWIRQPLIGFGGAIILALIVFTPLIPGMIETFTAYHAPVETEAAGVSEWKNPLWTAFEIMRSFGAVGAVIPVALVFAGFGAWRMAKRAPLIAIPYLIHIPMTLVILIAASFRIWPRYFFVDIGFLIGCVVIGAFWFAEVFAAKTASKFRFGLDANALKILGALAMVATSLPLLAGNYAAPKQNFPAALALVEQRAAPGDTIAVVGLADFPFNAYFEKGWPLAETSEQLAALEAAPGDLWVVTAFPAHVRGSFPEISKTLSEHFDFIEDFGGTLSGGEIVIYRSRPQ